MHVARLQCFVSHLCFRPNDHPILSSTACQFQLSCEALRATETHPRGRAEVPQQCVSPIARDWQARATELGRLTHQKDDLRRCSGSDPTWGKTGAGLARKKPLWGTALRLEHGHPGSQGWALAPLPASLRQPCSAASTSTMQPLSVLLTWTPFAPSSQNSTHNRAVDSRVDILYPSLCSSLRVIPNEQRKTKQLPLSFP